MQGIYIIECNQENKVYIGSSVNIDRRWAEHKYKLNKGTHHTKELQLAWDAYGDESFIFRILEQTDKLAIDEQKWLNSFADRLYNSSLAANNPQRNPDTINKIRDTMQNRYGTKSKGGKFNQEQVLEIIARINAGETPIAIAESIGVHYSSIYYIKSGKNWKHLNHLIVIPKKPRDIAFELFAAGFTRHQVYEKLAGKHAVSVIWNWEKAYKSKS